VIIALAGIFLAFALYRKESLAAGKISASLGALYQVIYHKFYIDEIYLFVTRRILFNLVSRPVAWFDRHVVDGTMNRIAWVISVTSDRIKGLQSGRLQHYALVFVSGRWYWSWSYCTTCHKACMMSILLCFILIPVLTIAAILFTRDYRSARVTAACGMFLQLLMSGVLLFMYFSERSGGNGAEILFYTEYLWYPSLNIHFTTGLTELRFP